MCSLLSQKLVEQIIIKAFWTFYVRLLRFCFLHVHLLTNVQLVFVALSKIHSFTTKDYTRTKILICEVEKFYFPPSRIQWFIYLRLILCFLGYIKCGCLLCI